MATQPIGEEPLPAVLRIILSTLGFQEPSWAALFIVVVSALGRDRDPGDE